jgi:hypothetical protein
MSTSAVPTSPTQLSQGKAIEYKAYERRFFETGAGTLFVVASCYYITSGFTIFFEENSSGQLCLMEQPPTGVFLNMVTYYVASWTNNRNADTNQDHLTIVDGYGEHHIRVRSWE